MKKKVILPFVTMWMDLEDIMVSEINQTQKDKYGMISFIGGIYIVKLTEAESGIMAARGCVEEERGNVGQGAQNFSYTEE